MDITLAEMVWDLLNGHVWVQGCATGRKPRPDVMADIDQIAHSLAYYDVIHGEDAERVADETACAYTADEWAAMPDATKARAIAAECVKDAIENACAAMGVDTDGYSCTVQFGA